MSTLGELFERELQAALAYIHRIRRENELLAQAARGGPFYCVGKAQGNIIDLEPPLPHPKHLDLLLVWRLANPDLSQTEP